MKEDVPFFLNFNVHTHEEFFLAFDKIKCVKDESDIVLNTGHILQYVSFGALKALLSFGWVTSEVFFFLCMVDGFCIHLYFGGRL